jgi:glycolate oxidase
MRAIKDLDVAAGTISVEAGVVMEAVQKAADAADLFFPLDLGGRGSCQIGGNVSTNAGGPHCLKYGITTNHVLALEFVTGAGEVIRVGGKAADRPGYDLPGAMVGAEGTFGLVTAITVRLLHLPEAVKTVLAAFATVVDASEAVSAIIAAGIVPAALEMLDEAMVGAINAAVGKVYPDGAGAVLLIELDGPRAEVETQGERIAAICRERQALFVTVARDELERALLWKGRKEAAGAIGRIASAYLLQDAVVPRSKLPHIMREMIALGRRYNVMIANVFHAGDGNLHPMICYDDRNPDEFRRAQEANEALLQACIALGGSVTGEHGVGMDKAKNLPLQYADADLNFMYRLRRVFDPDGLMNPAKLLPSHPACGEGFRPTRPRLPDGAWV